MKRNKYITFAKTSGGAIYYNSLDNKYILLNDRLHNIFENETIDKIQSNETELYDLLVKNSFIVDDEYCEEKIADLRRLALKLDKNLYHLVINTTLNCNLNCWYCYENKSTGSNIKDDVIDLIKKNIAIKFEETRFKVLKITFFGGEPLMNFKAVEEISNFSFSFCKDNNVELILDFTTNGSLLNKRMLKFLNKFKVKFQITLDGHKEKHNAIRYGKNNKSGTYDKIVANVKNILDSIEDSYVWIRINFDKDTLKNIPEIINDIKDFDKKRCSIILRKVWQVDINEIDKEELFNAINELMSVGLFVDYQALPRINPCFAEKVNQALINYDGKIFKCSTLEDFSDTNTVGYLNEEGRVIFDINKVAKAVIYTAHKTCRECNLYPACYGPCGQNGKNKENFRCTLNNLGISKEELVIYNFKLKLLADKIYS